MNKFEAEIVELIKKIIPVTSRRSISVVADNAIKQFNDSNKLFIQCCSVYPTITGRQRRNDLSLYCPEFDIDWRIECKSRQTPNGLIGEIINEFNYVTEIPEKLYCLVYNKVLDVPYVRERIQNEIDLRGLNNRVWYGTKKEFKKYLLKQL